MSLKGNRKAVRLAAGITTTFLAFFGVSAIASANPDDGYSEETEVVVTSVPTPVDNTSDEEVTTTDVETTDEEGSEDTEYIPGETWEETETIAPEYDDPEGEWTDDGYSEEYPTTTDCPPTEEYPETDYPDEEYPDEEEEPCCPEEEEGGDDNSVENGNEINNENNNSNENNQEQNNNQEVEVNVEGGGDTVDNSVDIGGVDVNVKVPISIDNSVTNVTKVTETNEYNETTVLTEHGDVIVVKPDGNGGHTIVKRYPQKASTPEEVQVIISYESYNELPPFTYNTGVDTAAATKPLDKPEGNPMAFVALATLSAAGAGAVVVWQRRRKGGNGVADVPTI